jgi:hypothetical protein
MWKKVELLEDHSDPLTQIAHGSGIGLLSRLFLACSG